MPYAHITGWGMSAPERVLTNDELAKVVDTNDAWIRERTGIRERRIAREDQFPSTLAVEASIKALRVANLRPTDLDLIICSTSSPEYIFPATACLIQDQLGATKAGAFDLLAPNWEQKLNAKILAIGETSAQFHLYLVNKPRLKDGVRISPGPRSARPRPTGRWWRRWGPRRCRSSTPPRSATGWSWAPTAGRR